MRQLERLFGKLDAVSQQRQTAGSTHPDHISRKLQRVSSSLARTSRKLDHVAGDFTSHDSDDAEYQAA